MGGVEVRGIGLDGAGWVDLVFVGDTPKFHLSSCSVRRRAFSSHIASVGYLKVKKLN